MYGHKPGTLLLEVPDKSSETSNPSPVRLCQWPIKINKIAASAPYFHKANLVISTDCVAYAYENFRKSLKADDVLVIGCPDLEIAEMTLKLTEILRLNDILSISVMRMDTPCCKQLSQAIFLALRSSGKDIPFRLTTVFTEGEIID
jgi:hypothetical protein